MPSVSKGCLSIVTHISFPLMLAILYIWIWLK
jgi:hypothetical protein